MGAVEAIVDYGITAVVAGALFWVFLRDRARLLTKLEQQEARIAVLEGERHAALKQHHEEARDLLLQSSRVIQQNGDVLRGVVSVFSRLETACPLINKNPGVTTCDVR